MQSISSMAWRKVTHFVIEKSQAQPWVSQSQFNGYHFSELPGGVIPLHSLKGAGLLASCRNLWPSHHPVSFSTCDANCQLRVVWRFFYIIGNGKEKERSIPSLSEDSYKPPPPAVFIVRRVDRGAALGSLYSWKINRLYLFTWTASEEPPKDILQTDLRIPT